MINMLSEDLISRVGLILLSVVLAIRCGMLKVSLEESKKKEVLLKQNIAQERVRHDERIMKLQDYVDELTRDGKYKDKQIYELNMKLEKILCNSSGRSILETIRTQCETGKGDGRQNQLTSEETNVTPQYQPHKFNRTGFYKNE